MSNRHWCISFKSTTRLPAPRSLLRDTMAIIWNLPPNPPVWCKPGWDTLFHQ
jgi:hypothetical protein